MATEKSTPTDDVTKYQSIDSAALAAAATAAVITLLVDPGPFVPMSIIIGLTLLLFLLGYELRRMRNLWQCFAFGAACAFCGLLVVGFGIEIVCVQGWRWWHVEDWERLMKLEVSCLGFWDLMIAWGILMAVFTAIGYICRIRT
jgi:hypothetical protein